MIADCPFTRFADALEAFIRDSLSGGAPSPDGQALRDDDHFNRLALSLFELQFQHNAPYRQFCQRRGASPESVEDWTRVPSVPTAAFKELELTSLPPADRMTVFHSSGTTDHRPSRHFHNHLSLKLYEAALLPWLQIHLLPQALRPIRPLRPISPSDGSMAGAAASDRSSFRAFLCLTPPPALAPHSSLVHMFGAVCRTFGGAHSQFVGVAGPSGTWQLDLAATLDALDRAVRDGRPLLLLGAAFSFVQLLDVLAEQHLHYALPAGSRLLETGGYKGRTRALPKAELHALVTERLGIALANIVSEYGMSELSSQAYDGVAGEVEQLPSANHQSPMAKRQWPSGTSLSSIANSQSRIANGQAARQRRVYRFPPWARVRIVSPETGREVDEGETGLICIVDLANAWSVVAVQTEDLGIRRGDGFELIGRAPLAEPRGCSLMAAA